MKRDDASILGTVAWPGGEIVATLFGDGTWSLPGLEWMEGPLKLLFSDDYRGPSDGPFGPRALADAAASVGGTFEYRDRPGPAEGTVY